MNTMKILKRTQTLNHVVERKSTIENNCYEAIQATKAKLTDPIYPLPPKERFFNILFLCFLIGNNKKTPLQFTVQLNKLEISFEY